MAAWRIQARCPAAAAPGGGRGSQSSLGSLALAFAKVVQRRLGPKGTTGPLLRKKGWRVVSAVLRAECQNQASITPLPPPPPLWPGLFPLEFRPCSQLRPFFLPTSPPFSCLTPLGRPKLPSVGMWLCSHSPGGRGAGGEQAQDPQLLVTNLWRQTGSWRQWVERDLRA